MSTQKIKAENRKITGRKVKALRSQGILPANIFGKKIKSVAIQVDYKDFEKVYHEVGETGIIEIILAKKTLPTLISNLQKDTVTGKIIHADFHSIDLKEKVTAKVPVEIKGESPAVKNGLGTAVQQLDEIEIEALPTDIPEKFVVDITSLENVDDGIYVKDIKFSKKIEVKEDLEKIVISVQPLQKEEVVVVAPKPEQEAQVEGETPKEEIPAEENKEETPKE
ncbi:MAG: 50S ribosomal protein L25 [Candidatus Woesebacteria bacterium]|nr:MAG: 50S ribosomal protein L25 [Candidatus Woesebacteria bacterium]